MNDVLYHGSLSAWEKHSGSTTFHPIQLNYEVFANHFDYHGCDRASIFFHTLHHQVEKHHVCLWVAGDYNISALKSLFEHAYTTHPYAHNPYAYQLRIYREEVFRVLLPWFEDKQASMRDLFTKCELPQQFEE